LALLLLACLLPARAWLLGRAEAQDLSGNPGTASDPLITVNSLQQHLNQLFATQTQQLDELQHRLDLVAAGIQALQGGGGGQGGGGQGGGGQGNGGQGSGGQGGGVAAPFPDLNGHWAAAAVAALKARGIISGYPDGKFHPNDEVNRASMAVMLTRAKNLAANPGAAGFPDVPPGYWAAGAVGAARAAGYLEGYPDGSFRPQRGLSRAEAAVLLDKAFAPRDSGRTSSFSDVGSSFWAAGAIRQMAAAGIISGYPDGAFKPDRVMSRAEAAALLAKLLQPS
jgi:hypothetical protein